MAEQVGQSVSPIAEHDELREAARAWLRFDNDVEPPQHDDPYEKHLAYEEAKFAITERVAAAIKEAEA